MDIKAIILAIVIFNVANVYAQGEYTIRVTDSESGAIANAEVTFGGVSAFTDSCGIVTIENPAVGVGGVTAMPEEFQVGVPYGNPVKGNDVEFALSNASPGVFTFTLYNVLSEEIGAYKTYLPIGERTIKVSGFTGAPSGVYFIKITDGKTARVKKIINVNCGEGSGAISFTYGGAPKYPYEKTATRHILLTVKKDGYFDYTDEISPERHNITAIMEKTESGKIFSGYVYDNVKYTFGQREAITTKVTIYYNETAHIETGDNFDFRIPLALNVLDSIKVVGIGADTSFILTYREFPIDENLEGLEFLVTTFNGLIYDYGVSPDSALTVEQFEAMAEMGVFKMYFTEGLKGINVDNLDNPIYENHDPDNGHGSAYFIAGNQLADIFPGAITHTTPEQREAMAEFIENDILPKYPEGKRMRVIVLDDDDPPPGSYDSTGHWEPYPGVHIVYLSAGGMIYGFGSKDYNRDGFIDASYVGLGTDFATNLAASRQELHSVFVTMPIEPLDVSGDISRRSIFLQSGYKSSDFTKTFDNKIINGVLLNISEELTTKRGERIKVNYPVKTPQMDLLGGE